MVDSAGGRSQISQLTAGRDRRRRPAVPDRPARRTCRTRSSPSVVFLIGIRLIDYQGHGRHPARPAGRVRGRRDHGRDRGRSSASSRASSWRSALSIIEHIYHSYQPYDSARDRGAPTAASGRSPIEAGRTAGARAGGLPLRGEPVLRQRDPLHGRGHGPGRRGADPPLTRVRDLAARPSATSTTRAPTRCGRCRRSSRRRA